MAATVVQAPEGWQDHACQSRERVCTGIVQWTVGGATECAACATVRLIAAWQEVMPGITIAEISAIVGRKVT